MAIDCLIVTTDVETVTFGVMTIIVFVQKHADVCHQSVVRTCGLLNHQSVHQSTNLLLQYQLAVYSTSILKTRDIVPFHKYTAKYKALTSNVNLKLKEFVLSPTP